MVKYPDPLDLPTNLNPHAVDQWFQACRSLDQYPDPRSAWRAAVGIYTDLCRSTGLSPFVGPKDGNVAIRNFLYTRRRKLIRFLDTTNLMVGVPVLRQVKRDVRALPNGFTVRVSAQVRIQDPTWVSRLTKFPFGYRFGLLRNKQRQYVLKLDPSLTVFVYNDQIAASHQWHIGYTVQCPIKPNYPAGHDESQFILEQLWHPMMTKFRPSRVNQILHL